MKKLTFAEKNDLIVKHKGAASFDRDLELFKKYYPAHSLLKDLARANSFSFARLDGQMLGLLLDVASIDEILENREKEPEKPIEPKTIEEIKQLLIKELGLDEKDLDALSKIILDWTTKSDDEILSAVKTLYGENKPAEVTSGEGSGEGKDASNTELTKVEGTIVVVEKLELPNSQKTQAMIAQAETIEAVNFILDAEKADKKRTGVLNAGAKRIEELHQPEDPSKKKD